MQKTRLLRGFLVSLCVLSGTPNASAQWALLGLDNQDICSVITDPRNPGIIYAASVSNFSIGTVGRLFKSTDGGATWDTLSPRAAFQILVMDPDSSNIIYAGMGTANFGIPGILKTTDTGQTWFHADSGLAQVGVVDIAIDKRDPEILFAGLIQMLGGFLYKSRNGGRTWYPVVDSTPAGQGGLSEGIYTIAINPDSESVMFAGGGSLGDLMKSIDSGETWRISAPRLDYATQLVYGAHGSDIYMGATSSSAHPKGLLHSTDGGSTWTPIVTGLPGNYADVWALRRIESSGSQQLFIGAHTWISSGNPDSGRVDGVFISTDSGNSWRNLGLDSVLINSLALSPDRGTIYAGVFRVNPDRPGGVYARHITLSVRESTHNVPHAIRVYPPYPNPFNPSTTFVYDLGETLRVRATIYSIEGKRITSLRDCYQGIGHYQIAWDGTNDRGIQLSAGIYLFQLETVQPRTGQINVHAIKVVLVR